MAPECRRLVTHIVIASHTFHFPNDRAFYRTSRRSHYDFVIVLHAVLVHGIHVPRTLVILGIAAVVALFHDVILTLGLISILDMEITLAVVAGLLAIVGYSLNDTIVVFARIRENLLGHRRLSFPEILDGSINECLSRTVITSLTTLMAVVAMILWGGEVIRDFTITLLIGIFVGTYSSMFVASPVLYYGHARSASRDEGRKKDKRK